MTAQDQLDVGIRDDELLPDLLPVVDVTRPVCDGITVRVPLLLRLRHVIVPSCVLVQVGMCTRMAGRCACRFRTLSAQARTSSLGPNSSETTSHRISVRGTRKTAELFSMWAGSKVPRNQDCSLKRATRSIRRSTCFAQSASRLVRRHSRGSPSTAHTGRDRRPEPPCALRRRSIAMHRQRRRGLPRAPRRRCSEPATVRRSNWSGPGRSRDTSPRNTGYEAARQPCTAGSKLAPSTRRQRRRVPTPRHCPSPRRRVAFRS